VVPRRGKSGALEIEVVANLLISRNLSPQSRKSGPYLTSCSGVFTGRQAFLRLPEDFQFTWSERIAKGTGVERKGRRNEISTDAIVVVFRVLIQLL